MKASTERPADAASSCPDRGVNMPASLEEAACSAGGSSSAMVIKRQPSPRARTDTHALPLACVCTSECGRLSSLNRQTPARSSVAAGLILTWHSDATRIVDCVIETDVREVPATCECVYARPPSGGHRRRIACPARARATRMPHAHHDHAMRAACLPRNSCHHVTRAASERARARAPLSPGGRNPPCGRAACACWAA